MENGQMEGTETCKVCGMTFVLPEEEEDWEVHRTSPCWEECDDCGETFQSLEEYEWHAFEEWWEELRDFAAGLYWE